MVVVVVVVLQFWGVPGLTRAWPVGVQNPHPAGALVPFGNGAAPSLVQLAEQPLRGATDPPELCRPLRLGPLAEVPRNTRKYTQRASKGFKWQPREREKEEKSSAASMKQLRLETKIVTRSR